LKNNLNFITSTLLSPIFNNIKENPELADSALTDELLEMMDIYSNPRELTGCLSHIATKSVESKGRKFWTDDLGLVWLDLDQDQYDIDKTKIRESRAYRRHFRKAQVFYQDIDQIDGVTKVLNPHTRNRGTHGQSTANDAINVATTLGLNATLCEAGSLGHDIGQPPFSHCGEFIIQDYLQKRFGKDYSEFEHATFGVIILQQFEYEEYWHTNLTWETYQTIAMHSKIKITPENLAYYPAECFVVYFCDKNNYTWADAQDMLRNPVEEINNLKFPLEYFQLGTNPHQRAYLCKLAFIKECYKARTISYGQSTILDKFQKFRNWMFENVYFNLNRQITKDRIHETIQILEHCFPQDPLLCLALLSDEEVIMLSESKRKANGDNSWRPSKEMLKSLSLNEIHHLPEGIFDFGSAQLDPRRYTKMP